MTKVINANAIREAFDKVDRKKLSKQLGTTVSYLNQVISGFKRVSFQRAIEIEKVTGIKKEILRSDIWGKK
jgi:DNA-binding transcriptional regulator YdaS (Cro superfamily)